MRYSITSNYRIYQIYNWDKYVFYWEKLNFERIGNSVHSAEFFKFFKFFSVWVFFHSHSRIIGLQEKGEDTSLTPHYHFHPLQKHLNISRVVTAESSPLHIGSSSWTRTGNLWFPSES